MPLLDTTCLRDSGLPVTDSACSCFPTLTFLICNTRAETALGTIGCSGRPNIPCSPSVSPRLQSALNGASAKAPTGAQSAPIDATSSLTSAYLRAANPQLQARASIRRAVARVACTSAQRRGECSGRCAVERFAKVVGEYSSADSPFFAFACRGRPKRNENNSSGGRGTCPPGWAAPFPKPLASRLAARVRQLVATQGGP